MSRLISSLTGMIFHNIILSSASGSSKRTFSKYFPKEIYTQILERKEIALIVTK
jgi:hypothetical protein